MNFYIGQTVYIQKTNSCGFRHYKVLGETSRSWIVLSQPASEWKEKYLDKYADKLPKNGKGYIVVDELTVWDEEDEQLLAASMRDMNADFPND
jgi:hypothetical protein